MSSVYRNGRFFWYRKYPDKPISLKTADRGEAELMKAKLDIQHSERPTANHTCESLISQYLDTIRQGCSLSYVKDTAKRLKALCVGITHIQDVTEPKIQEYLKTLHSKYDVNNGISAIKAWLRWCLYLDFINKNPAERIKKINIQESPRLSYTPEQVKEIIQRSEGETIYPLVMIAIYTGMRKSELLRLDWKDIDLKEGIITVKMSKSKKIRRIPISDELMPVLKPYRKEQGSVCDLHNHRRIIGRILKPFGGGWHHFRHTFCTLALRAGVDLQTVKDLAGHSSVAVTALYLSSTPTHHKSAVNALSFTKNTRKCETAIKTAIKKKPSA